jgi:hypothetical protein
MNTTPKQHDDEGIAAAEGPRPSLENTVMGVAPPPSGVTPAGAAPRVGTLREPALAEAPAPDARSTIVAAPMIAVAETRALDAARVVGASAASSPPPLQVASGEGTLMVTPPAPSDASASDAQGRHPSSSSPAPSGAIGIGQTALSEDYLRAAREAALAQLAARPGATENAPDPAATLAATGATAAAAPLPSPVEPERPTEPQHDPRGGSARDPHEAPPSVGTVRSFAPPLAITAPSIPEGRPPATSRGFEPVPVVRAPLAESLSGALSPIVELGSHRHAPPSFRPLPVAPTREGVGRWVLLASVALATVGVVTLGSRLLDRYRSSAVLAQPQAAERPGARSDTPASSASRALMANRPAPERAADGKPRVVWATGAPGLANAESRSVEATSASPESQLAATAGRHVLSGNYAEALPLYRQLESRWPENTGYAVMARLLEKRLGAAKDTRTIAPTEPGSARPR